MVLKIFGPFTPLKNLYYQDPQRAFVYVDYVYQYLLSQK